MCWGGNPFIPRNQCTPQPPPVLKACLRFARILQTPLFDPRLHLRSDLSLKTLHSNVKYKEIKANELFCQQKMLYLQQRLRNHAQSHHHPHHALRDEWSPSSGPAGAEVGATQAICTLISGLKNPIPLLTAGSNTPGLGSRTPG